MNAVETANSFVEKAKIVTNLYVVLVDQFDFISSEEWTNAEGIERFLNVSYEKILECRKHIYKRININRDINNPTIIGDYHPIYDSCLNIFNAFEEKYNEWLEEEETI